MKNMTNHESDQARMKRYLLRATDKEESSKIERTLFPKDGLLEEAENGLVEDYVERRLSAADREAFVKHFLVTDERKLLLALQPVREPVVPIVQPKVQRGMRKTVWLAIGIAAAVVLAVYLATPPSPQQQAQNPPAAPTQVTPQIKETVPPDGLDRVPTRPKVIAGDPKPKASEGYMGGPGERGWCYPNEPVELRESRPEQDSDAAKKEITASQGQVVEVLLRASDLQAGFHVSIYPNGNCPQSVADRLGEAEIVAYAGGVATLRYIPSKSHPEPLTKDGTYWIVWKFAELNYALRSKPWADTIKRVAIEDAYSGLEKHYIAKLREKDWRSRE